MSKLKFTEAGRLVPSEAGNWRPSYRSESRFPSSDLGVLQIATCCTLCWIWSGNLADRYIPFLLENQAGRDDKLLVDSDIDEKKRFFKLIFTRYRGTEISWEMNLFYLSRSSQKKKAFLGTSNRGD